MKLDLNNPRTQRGHNRYLLELRQLARTNRNNPTPAESLLWNVVLKKKYLGYRFLRQKPLNRFILDFYSPKLLLDVEVDGDSHLPKKYYDLGRDRILLSIGIETVRYQNEMILESLENVSSDLRSKIEKRSNQLNISPLLKGRCPKDRRV